MSKEGNKKGGGKAVAGAGVLVLLAAGLFKFQPFGLPFGFDPPGSGNDSSVSEDSGSEKPAVTEAPKEEETTSEPTSPSADITVSGKEYLYQNRKISLEELIEEMKKLGENAEIRIFTEEDYTANAMDSLTKALDEAGITYMVVKERM